MSLLPVMALPAVSQSLVDALSKKAVRGEDVGVVWRRLVYRELEWCSEHISELSYHHRMNACKLVDWHHSYYGYTHERWLPLYPSRNEMYRRQVCAELNYCANHLHELTARHRDKAIELLEEIYQSCPEDYQSAWNVLLDF